MKTLLFALSLFASTVYAIPSDYVPHLDKAFLAAPSMREEFVENLSADVQPFCEMVEKYSLAQLDKVKIEARESCHIKEVVHGLEQSENELQIKSGEPFLMRVQRGSFDEAAVWRYFIRTQEVRRLLTSVRVYFSQAAGANKARVGMIGIPLFAASLDNYSYWTRLIAMKDSSWCPPDNKRFCDLLEPQLATLAKRSWTTMPVRENLFVINERQKRLLAIADNLKTRLSRLTLDELLQLEKMDNVTAAGLGIPYFRQLLAHLNISGEEISPAEQHQIQRAIWVSEIRDALSRWNLNVQDVDVSGESVSGLAQEIQMVVNESGRVL